MFLYPYKECFVLLPRRCGISPFRDQASLLPLVLISNRCGTPQSTPSRPGSLLAHNLLSAPSSFRVQPSHHPVCGFDIICNSPIPQLVDIILNLIEVIMKHRFEKKCEELTNDANGRQNRTQKPHCSSIHTQHYNHL